VFETDYSGWFAAGRPTARVGEPALFAIKSGVPGRFFALPPAHRVLLNLKG